MLSSFQPASSATINNFIDTTFVKVYDGDTINVLIPELPNPLNKVKVRLLGIDTAEMAPKAKCREEADRAVAAKRRVEELLLNTRTLRVNNVKWDKYGGRILGNIYVLINNKEVNITDILVEENLARRYNGIGVRAGWCP